LRPTLHPEFGIELVSESGDELDVESIIVSFLRPNESEPCPCLSLNLPFLFPVKALPDFELDFELEAVSVSLLDPKESTRDSKPLWSLLVDRPLQASALRLDLARGLGSEADPS
jgi:hypothetical protein